MRRRVVVVWALRVLVVLGAVGAGAPAAAAFEYAPAYPFETDRTGVAVAVNQTNDEVYVAQPAHLDPVTFAFTVGRIDRFDSAGDLLNRFGAAGFASYGAVAVDLSAQAVRAFDAPLVGPRNIGSFTATGTPAGSFVVTANSGSELNQIAVDASGTIFYPNAVTDSVEKFSPTGTPMGSIGAGGALVDPSSVAVDLAGNVYVVDGVVNGAGTCGTSACDDVSGGRVQKFAAAGGPPLMTVDSADVSSVAVDAASGNVLVGNGIGASFEVVVYDQSGTELTRFGSGEFSSQFAIEPGHNSEIAVNADTRRVYVTDPGQREVEMFDILPTATTGPASGVGRDRATLSATINPNGPEMFGCRFEYGPTTAYENTVPCASVPDAGSDPVRVDTHVSGLLPGTTYHYRVVATNGGGTANGADQTFTTTPPLPTPPPPPDTTGPTSPPPGQPPSGSAVLRWAGSSNTVKVRAGKARIKLTCTAPANTACKGTLKLTARIKTAANRKAKRVTVGKVSYTLPAGSTKTVEVALTRTARRALARSGRLRATVLADGLRRAITLSPVRAPRRPGP